MAFDIQLPTPMLVVERHEILRPRFPAIDAHNHLGPSFGFGWSDRSPSELADVLDEAGIETIVDLDGGFADHFQREMDKWCCLGERVLVFTGVGWKRLANKPDLGELAAEELERAVRAGARGLKIWKDLGLRIKDIGGELISGATSKLDD